MLTHSQWQRMCLKGGESKNAPLRRLCLRLSRHAWNIHEEEVDALTRIANRLELLKRTAPKDGDDLASTTSLRSLLGK